MIEATVRSINDAVLSKRDKIKLKVEAYDGLIIFFKV